MAYNFSQILHARMWNVIILHETLANGMRHHPKPIYANVACVHLECNVAQLHATSSKACAHQSRCVHIN